MLESSAGRPDRASGRRRSQQLTDDTTRFWRNWLGKSTYRGPVARDGRPLGDDAEADDLRADRRAGGRADRGTARAGRRRAQLGLPLHVGPRRVVLRLRAARPGVHRRRRRAFGSGCATGSRSGRRATAGPAEDHVPRRRLLRPRPRRRSTTWRATAARRRCASATAPPTSCSSTSTARRWTPSTIADAHGMQLAHQGWSDDREHASTGCATTGTSPTRASGRPAAAARTSSTAGCMSWVALDRAIRLATRPRPAGRPRPRGPRERDRIYDQIMDTRLEPKIGRRSSSTTAARCSTRRCC